MIKIVKEPRVLSSPVLSISEVSILVFSLKTRSVSEAQTKVGLLSFCSTKLIFCKKNLNYLANERIDIWEVISRKEVGFLALLLLTGFL